MPAACLPSVALVTTLSDRKAAEANCRSLAAETACNGLRAYAREHGGRFVVFSACASGTVRFDSDLDVLVDFPGAALGGGADVDGRGS